MSLRKVQMSSGIQVIAANGTAEALVSTETRVRSVIITANSGNTSGEHVTVGDSNVVGALVTRRGHPLSPGESLKIDFVGGDEDGTHGVNAGRAIDLADIYVDCITNDDSVSWIAFA